MKNYRLSRVIICLKDGLLSDKSYILTNNHVVENADKIRVKLKDGREFTAEVAGADPQSEHGLETSGSVPICRIISSQLTSKEVFHVW